MYAGGGGGGGGGGYCCELRLRRGKSASCAYESHLVFKEVIIFMFNFVLKPFVI